MNQLPGVWIEGLKRLQTAFYGACKRFSLLFHMLRLSRPFLKPMPVDTITTRFLMVFIFLLAVPVITVTLFTLSLLENDANETMQSQLNVLQETWAAYLNRSETWFADLAQGDFDRLLCTQHHGKNVVFPLLCFTKPGMSDYSWSNRGLTYRVALKSGKKPYTAIGFTIDRPAIQRFYQNFPSLSSGEILIIPAEDALLPQYQKRRALINPLLPLTINSNQSAPLHSALNNQSLSRQPVDVPFMFHNERNNQDYWVMQRFISDQDGLNIARIVLAITAPTSTKFQSYYWSIYWLSVIAIVLAVILAMVVGRPITQPLLKLIRQINAINHNNLLSGKLQVQGVHEINQLTQAFNSLLSRLKQEHAMRDEFVATLTHDLKVPMLAEKQTLNYILKGVYGPLTEAQGDVLKVIESTNTESLTLVNGLLEVYRYESGTVHLSLGEVDARQLMCETMQTLKPLAEAKSIRLCLKTQLLDAQSAPVHADSLEIKRVLHNLLNNAITNTPAYGDIVCRVETSQSLGSLVVQKVSGFQRSTLRHPVVIKDRVLISIQDSGIGFDSEDLPRLFQQFSASRGRNPMSIGLGLFNCFQVVEAHQGMLWVETTEGEGSAVSFTLPQHVDAFADRRRQDRRHGA